MKLKNDYPGPSYYDIGGRHHSRHNYRYEVTCGVKKFHIRAVCSGCSYHVMSGKYNNLDCCPDCGLTKEDGNWEFVSAKWQFTDETEPVEHVRGLIFREKYFVDMLVSAGEWIISTANVCEYCGFGEEKHKIGCEGCGA